MTYVIVLGLTSLIAGLLLRVASVQLSCAAIGLVLATFAALRGPEVAADFITYENWYAFRDLESGFLERPGYFEAAFFLLNDFFGALGVPFRAFIWMIAFAAVYLKARVIVSFSGSEVAAAVGLLVYAVTFYLLHDFTQIRAGMAVALIFIAFRSLIDGNRRQCILFIILAMGFHSSALLGMFLLLPRQGSVARLVDYGLVVVACVCMLFAARGIALGAAFIGLISALDPRLTHYVSLSEMTHAQPANPFAISALLLLALGLSLIGAETRQAEVEEEVADFDDAPKAHEAHPEGEGRNAQDSVADGQEGHVMVVVRRAILIGIVFLVSLSPIPELALRLLELTTSLIPILAATVFWQRGWLLQKALLLLWAGAVAYVYIFREEGLVRPYVLFFS